MLTRVLRSETGLIWERPSAMPRLLHTLLLKRGISSLEEAERFLNPDAENLHDPFLLSDMRAATEIIKDAVAKNEKICVYGDYDVDGVCASAILTLYLKSIGANCGVYLPSRHQEGYGLNADAIDKLAAEYKLLVTVDCGITARELTEQAKRRGMRVIITDHHRPEGELPDCPVINPLLNNYPFGYLCGTGVAFKLVYALGGRRAAMEHLDLAALATIADIVPLKDENRIIAALGLKRMNEALRPGLRALLKVSGMEGKYINAGNVAFQLTPRLNAGGRIGDAKRAYNLLTSLDESECESLAEELNNENTLRKTLELEAIAECEKQLADFDFTANRVIVVHGEGWNPGVIGLVASRLTEKYHYPAVVLTRDEDSYTGSCRSIDGVDIHDALSAVQSLLERFGGHRMAAGLKLKSENLNEFKLRLNEFIKATAPESVFMPRIEYDADIEINELDEKSVRTLEALAPFGCDNPAPMLRLRSKIAEARAVGTDNAHLKLSIGEDDTLLPGIWFRNGHLAGRLPQRADILFAPSINVYRDNITVQADVKDIAAADIEAAIEGAGSDEALAVYLLKTFKRQPAQAADEITITEAREALAASARGTVIVCPDEDSAKRCARQFKELENCEVYAGIYPGDGRCFNAIAIAPIGECPSGYKNVISAGFPAVWAAGRRIKELPLAPAFAYMPDVDNLRCIYIAVRDTVRRQTEFRSLEALIRCISLRSGLNAVTAAAGLAALADMGLIALTDNEKTVLELTELKKAEPLSNPLFCEMLRLKGEGV